MSRILAGCQRYIKRISREKLPKYLSDFGRILPTSGYLDIRQISVDSGFKKNNHRETPLKVYYIHRPTSLTFMHLVTPKKVRFCDKPLNSCTDQWASLWAILLLPLKDSLIGGCEDLSFKLTKSNVYLHTKKRYAVPKTTSGQYLIVIVFFHWCTVLTV